MEKAQSIYKVSRWAANPPNATQSSKRGSAAKAPQPHAMHLIAAYLFFKNEVKTGITSTLPVSSL